MHSPATPTSIRQLVVEHFARFGADAKEAETCAETILIRDGKYRGRSYSTAGILAMWIIEIVLVRFYAAAGAVRGSGDTRSPMIRGVTAVWLAVLIAWLGVHFLDQSIAWIWGTFIVTGLLPAFGNWRAFKRRADDLGRSFRQESFPALDPAASA